MTDEELCNLPMDEAGEIRCMLPAGHPGTEHEFSGPLPADVARIIAEMLNRTEQEIAKFHAMYLRQRRAWWFALGAAALNLATLVWTLARSWP